MTLSRPRLDWLNVRPPRPRSRRASTGSRPLYGLRGINPEPLPRSKLKPRRGARSNLLKYSVLKLIEKCVTQFINLKQNFKHAQNTLNILIVKKYRISSYTMNKNQNQKLKFTFCTHNINYNEGITLKLQELRYSYCSYTSYHNPQNHD